MWIHLGKWGVFNFVHSTTGSTGGELVWFGWEAWWGREGESWQASTHTFQPLQTSSAGRKVSTYLLSVFSNSFVSALSVLCHGSPAPQNVVFLYKEGVPVEAKVTTITILGLNTTFLIFRPLLIQTSNYEFSRWDNAEDDVRAKDKEEESALLTNTILTLRI